METTIVLPSYVSALSTHLIAQVVPIFTGSLRLLNVSKVVNNAFSVHGAPGEFNWVVYGKRGDLVVEPDKATANVSGQGPYRWIQ
jgi:hypothetical protein